MPLSLGNGPPMGHPQRQNGLHSRAAVAQLRISKHSAVILALLLLCCLVPRCTAAAPPPPPANSASNPTEPHLLIDHRLPVFVDGHWQIMSSDEQVEIRPQMMRRVIARSPKQEAATQNPPDEQDLPAPGGVTSTIEFVPPTATGKPSSTKPATKTSSQAPTSTGTTINSPLPSPFDGALAANFSDANGGACPAFFQSFLADPTFKACYPFSILLQGSTSFFQAQKSFSAITRVLDATCAADVNTCTPYLEQLAKDLVSDANCGVDYRQGNSLVVQAYMGLRAYKTLYSATCLTDEKTSSYCFAHATTDQLSNYYLYYMPLNSSYPPEKVPTCGSCTKQTMGIFQAAAADRYSSIAYTYPNASLIVNKACGAGFVNATLPEPLSSQNGADTLAGPTATVCLLTTLFAMAVSWL